MNTLRPSLPLRRCAIARVIFFLFLFSSSGLAARVEPLIDTWKPQHYLVNITLNDQLSEITSASVRINLTIVKPTRELDIEFGDLTIDRVMLNGSPHTFLRKDGNLHLDLPQSLAPGKVLVLQVDYHGRPKDGLILTKDKDGHPSAVGDNWPNRVHHWIPALDHPSAKATVTFNITAPAGQEVVANGRLDHVEITASGQRTWTYSEGVPIPPYCMIIAVGQFAKVEPSERAVTPLSYYVPLSERDLALKGFSPVASALSFFTQTVALYPYEKLALIVGATRFGGMENSSAIVFTSNLLNRAPSPIGMSAAFKGVPINNLNLISHEIAHQWFGDSVTESTWSDLWLSEGFATYFAGLFLQRTEGEDAFRVYMNNAALAVLAYEKKKLVPIFDRDTENLMDLLNANNYQKGAWILHMLRSQLGDDAFFRGIRSYYETHKNATASSEDLRAAFEKASGKDLRAFFARWVYDSGHPQYELSWEWVGMEELKLVLTQVQSGNAFPDPVHVRVITAQGKHDVVLKPLGKQLFESIPFWDKPLSIEVDPQNLLLDEATVKG
ncbi:MAG TPA: M1 family metallopeptidase [Pyrinomonadaceae bacterium]|jgi:aminopeptidase N|nr:M1 family metallopeptidase [Pyrinomonadaceae bacterium]